jgi:hypothetical protein
MRNSRIAALIATGGLVLAGGAALSVGAASADVTRLPHAPSTVGCASTLPNRTIASGMGFTATLEDRYLVSSTDTTCTWQGQRFHYIGGPRVPDSPFTYISDTGPRGAH